MTALRFSEADALRCRFGISPVWETMSAVRVLYSERQRPVYEPWIAANAHVVAGLDLDVLRAVQPQVGYTPDFLTPPPEGTRTGFDTELARVRATPPERVAAELVRSRDKAGNPRADDVDALLADPAAARDRLADTIARVWTELVEPHWPTIRRVLDDDIAYRGHQLTTGGLAALFDDLHPTLTWEHDQLIATRYREPDRDLAGAGLLLMPGAFAWPHLVAVVDPSYQPTLVYPARGIAKLWTTAPAAPDRLARLMGRTRATLLTALDEPATTSALARLYGLALATVAEHLGALHGAGLVTRRRTGHKVHYRRTDLGQRLIDAAVVD